MNQTIKVEAYSKEAREDRNGNKIWGVLYKPSPNAQGTWINVHREQQPRKGETITGDLEEQKDKNGKSWWHLHVRLENPPKLAPQPDHPSPLTPTSEKQSDTRPSFGQIMAAIRAVKDVLGWENGDATAAVMQTVILRIGAGEIQPPTIEPQPDPFEGDAFDDDTGEPPPPSDRDKPPWEP